MPESAFKHALHAVWQPLRRMGRHVAEHSPFTLLGLIILLLATAMLQFYGYRRMDLVVFALTVCALVIVIGCLILVLMAGYSRRRQLRQQLPTLAGNPLRLEAGFPNETGFRLPTISWLPLVTLEWRIVYPDQIRHNNRLTDDGRHLEEQVTPQQRCRAQHITRLFTVRDVLGLCRLSWRQTQESGLLVLPRVGRIRHLPTLRSLSAEDGIPNPKGQPRGDRMEIRPYSPGDPVRNIMWGVYARNRDLNVRLEERSVFDSRRILAYLLSGPEDEAAAAVARIAVESGALGDDWVFGADGSKESSFRADTALELIAASRALDGKHAPGLDQFLAQQHDGNAHCIVFTAASVGPWTQALRQSLARFPGQCSVILATDGFKNAENRPWLQRMLYQTGRNRESDSTYMRPTASVGELGTLLQELRQFTGHAMIVDRHTGQSFDQQLKRV
jgi:hypothetical protein